MGESLEGYDKVTILDVYVAFKKDWQRNYIRDTMGMDGWVSDKDIEVIKKRLAGEFKTIFSSELEENGDIIARVMDAKAAGNHGIAHMGGRVENKAEFDRVLVDWADILRKHLDSLNTGK